MDSEEMLKRMRATARRVPSQKPGEIQRKLSSMRDVTLASTPPPKTPGAGSPGRLQPLSKVPNGNGVTAATVAQVPDFNNPDRAVLSISHVSQRCFIATRSIHTEVSESARATVLDMRRQRAGQELVTLMNKMFPNSDDQSMSKSGPTKSLRRDHSTVGPGSRGVPSVAVPSVTDLIDRMVEERREQHALSAQLRAKDTAARPGKKEELSFEEHMANQIRWLIQELGQSREQNEILDERYRLLLVQMAEKEDASHKAEERRKEAEGLMQDAFKLLADERAKAEETRSTLTWEVQNARQKLFAALEAQAQGLSGAAAAAKAEKTPASPKGKGHGSPSGSPKGVGARGGAGDTPQLPRGALPAAVGSTGEGGDEQQNQQQQQQQQGGLSFEEKEKYLRQLVEMRTELLDAQRETSILNDKLQVATESAERSRQSIASIRRNAEAEVANVKDMLVEVRNQHERETAALEADYKEALKQVEVYESAVHELQKQLEDVTGRMLSMQRTLMSGPSVQTLLYKTFVKEEDATNAQEEINRMTQAVSDFVSEFEAANEEAMVNPELLVKQHQRRKLREQQQAERAAREFAEKQREERERAAREAEIAAAEKARAEAEAEKQRQQSEAVAAAAGTPREADKDAEEAAAGSEASKPSTSRSVASAGGAGDVQTAPDGASRSLGVQADLGPAVAAVVMSASGVHESVRRESVIRLTQETQTTEPYFGADVPPLLSSVQPTFVVGDADADADATDVRLRSTNDDALSPTESRALQPAASGKTSSSKGRTRGASVAKTPNSKSPKPGASPAVSKTPDPKSSSTRSPPPGSKRGSRTGALSPEETAAFAPETPMSDAAASDAAYSHRSDAAPAPATMAAAQANPAAAARMKEMEDEERQREEELAALAPPPTIVRTAGVSKEQLAAMMKNSADDDFVMKEMERLRAAKDRAEIAWQEAHGKLMDVSKANKAANAKLIEVQAALEEVSAEREALKAQLEEEQATFAKSKDIVGSLNATVRKLEAESAFKEEQHTIEAKALHRDIIQLRQENKALALSDARAKMRAKEKVFIEASERMLRAMLSLQATSACPVCLEVLTDPVTLVPCGHVMCAKCFRENNVEHGLRVLGESDSIVFGPNTCVPVGDAAVNQSSKEANQSFQSLPSAGTFVRSGTVGALRRATTMSRFNGSSAGDITTPGRGDAVLVASPILSDASRALHERLRDTTALGQLAGTDVERVDSVAFAATQTLSASRGMKVTGWYCDECSGFCVTRIVAVSRVREVIDSVRYVQRNMEEIRENVVMKAAVIDGKEPPAGGKFEVKDSGEARLAAMRAATQGADLEVTEEHFLLDAD